MSKEKNKNLKLGAFVLVGLIFFVIVLVLIGQEQNMFERTFRISCRFANVDGLQRGSNVWFAGVKVGTVREVEIESSQSVRLELRLDLDVQPFIKTDAVASVGSDGFIGNKIVVISGGSETSEMIAHQGELKTSTGVSTDDLLTRFQVTNDNLAVISEGVKELVSQIQAGEGSLGELIADTVLFDRLAGVVQQARLASQNTERATRDLSEMTAQINAGQGMIGAILRDSSYTQRLEQSLANVEQTSDNAAQMVQNLSLMSTQLKALAANLENPNSPVGVLLTDSVFAENLSRTMLNLRASTSELDQTLEAAQESFFLRRRLFKKNKPKQDSPRGN